MGNSKSVLLCIDMQRDFLEPGSPLCVKEGLACLPKVIQAVDVARKSKVPVIWVIREHHPSGNLMLRSLRLHIKKNGNE